MVVAKTKSSGKKAKMVMAVSWRIPAMTKSSGAKARMAKSKRGVKRSKRKTPKRSKTSKKTGRRLKRKTVKGTRPKKSAKTVRRPKFQALSCIGGDATERVASGIRPTSKEPTAGAPTPEPQNQPGFQDVQAIGGAPVAPARPEAGDKTSPGLPRWATSTYSALTRKYSSLARSGNAISPKVSDISNIELVETGTKGTLDYKMNFQCKGKDISPWHEIPLYSNKEKTAVTFICEIPKNTAEKFEISRTVKNNPIIQDTTKDGKPRSYQWPQDKPRMLWNYGALPQTWEDPSHKEKDIEYPAGEHPGGDNDPIDAIMISDRVMGTGELCSVKVLGVLALIDDNETDWKLIVVDENDTEFKNINTLAELQTVKDGEYATQIQEMSNWLRDYKTISKKRVNHIHWDGRPRDENYAMQKVRLTHELWAKNTNYGRKNRELSS